jgi:hypothetical protein
MDGVTCREDHLSFDDRQDGRSEFQRSPTGPRVAPPRLAAGRPAASRSPAIRSRRPLWSAVIFIVLVSGLGIRAYRDLSRPEAWAYWKESYFAPKMTSALIADVDFDGTGPGRRALAISGEIGAASANWFRDRLDEVHLAAGDAVVLSSPGGDLNQGVVMGEIIRARGLVTAVGVVDVSGQVRPAYCASACVLVYAGGKTRYGVEGSMLGIHQFEATTPLCDPVASTQHIAGFLLGYMTKMGVSSAVVQAMSQTRDIRWLGVREAAAMNLVTEPVGKP